MELLQGGETMLLPPLGGAPGATGAPGAEAAAPLAAAGLAAPSAGAAAAAAAARRAPPPRRRANVALFETILSDQCFCFLFQTRFRVRGSAAAPGPGPRARERLARVRVTVVWLERCVACCEWLVSGLNGVRERDDPGARAQRSPPAAAERGATVWLYGRTGLRSAAGGRRIHRSGREVLDAAGDPGRVAAAAVVGAGGGGGARQEVRHGAEHQDGADEADAGAPAAADGLAAHAGAAPAGARAHVPGVRGVDLVRAEGGHDPAGLPAVRAHQVHQHVVGPGDAEAQGLRVRGVRDPGGRAAQPGADERRHARRPEHKGGGSSVEHAAGAGRDRRDPGGGQAVQPHLRRLHPPRAHGGRHQERVRGVRADHVLQAGVRRVGAQAQGLRVHRVRVAAGGAGGHRVHEPVRPGRAVPARGPRHHAAQRAGRPAARLRHAHRRRRGRRRRHRQDTGHGRGGEQRGGAGSDEAVCAGRAGGGGRGGAALAGGGAPPGPGAGPGAGSRAGPGAAAGPRAAAGAAAGARAAAARRGDPARAARPRAARHAAGRAAAQAARRRARHAAAAGVAEHLGAVGAAPGDAAADAAPRLAHRAAQQHGLRRRGGRRAAPRDTGGMFKMGPRGATRDLQRATERGRRPRARQRQDLRAVQRPRGSGRGGGRAERALLRRAHGARRALRPGPVRPRGPLRVAPPPPRASIRLALT